MAPNSAADSSAGISRSQWLGLLLFAVVLRGGVLWQLGDRLAEDRDNYRRLAVHVAAGDGFVDPQTLAPTAYRPPLYPLVVASVLGCGGSDMALGIVQLALGIATVALTVLCANRLGLHRGSSMAAGLFVAVDPLLLQQTALVMTETLAAFLAVLVLWLSLGSPTAIRSFSAGAAFGLCCLCRPTFWAFGMFAAVAWLVFQRAKRHSAATGDRAAEGASRWRQAVYIAAGAISIVAPWGIRNAIALGRPIITTTHGGYTLLLAHNPAYTRAVVEQPWGAVWDADSLAEWKASIEAELAGEDPPIDYAHLSPAVELARDKWMNGKAWKYMRGNPQVACRAGLTLLGRLWNVAPLATRETPLAPPMRLAIGLYYTTVLLAMLVGIVRAVRADARAWWPVVALVASFTVVHAIYWADMRMRTPLVPAIALLAAASGGARNDSRQ